MALSGMVQSTFYNPGNGARFAFRIYWSATQSVANNTSTVSITAKLAGLISTSSIVSRHSNSVTTVVFNGVSGTASNNISLSGVTEKTLYTASKTVTHNSDGTGSFTLSGTQQVAITFNGTYVSSTSISSSTQTLNTIPRASTFTSLGNFTTGGNPTCTIRRATTAFTNTVTMKVGSTVIKTLTNQGDLDSLVLSDSVNALLDNVPGLTGTLTVELKTMSGTTQIGSTVTRTCTITVNSSVVPTIGTISNAEQNNTVSTAIGGYVKGLSTVRLSVSSVAAGRGSSITAYEFTYNGVVYNTGMTTYKDVVASANGTISFSAKVKDGRRWSAAKTGSLTVLNYSAPTIATFKAERSNTAGTVSATGTSVKLTFNTSVSSLTVGGVQKNTISVNSYYRVKGTSTWTYSANRTGTTNVNTNYVLSTYPVSNAYEFRLLTVDKLGGQNESIVQVGSGSVLAAISPDGRWGFGKFPTAGITLDVGGVLNVDGAIQAGGGFSSPFTPNLDTTYVSGQYYYAESTISRPSSYGYVDVSVAIGSVYNGVGNWIWQTAYTTDGGIYQRSRINNGAWSGWREIYTSQSTQVLTSGDAKCTRYPNGWQEIHWRRTLSTAISLATGGNFFSNNALTEVSWPWAFNEIPTLQVTSSGPTQVAWVAAFGPANATKCPGAYMTRGSSDTRTFDYIINYSAHGRWK